MHSKFALVYISRNSSIPFSIVLPSNNSSSYSSLINAPETLNCLYSTAYPSYPVGSTVLGSFLLLCHPSLQSCNLSVSSVACAIFVYERTLIVANSEEQLINAGSTSMYFHRYMADQMSRQASGLSRRLFRHARFLPFISVPPSRSGILAPYHLHFNLIRCFFHSCLRL